MIDGFPAPSLAPHRIYIPDHHRQSSEEIILQDAIGFFQNRLAFRGEHGRTVVIQRGLGYPFFTAADLDDGFFDFAHQGFVFASLRPEDLFLYHRDVNHMKALIRPVARRQAMSFLGI